LRRFYYRSYNGNLTTTMKNAALYLRSSKDRSDISPDVQRRQLTDLAAELGASVVQEYADVVESAKSEHRPAFQKMIADMRAGGRRWDTILIADHSRLSRQPYVGHVFRYEASKSGVEVVFGNMPTLDPVSKVIMDSVMDAFAVVHSIMSREKGLAGMAENVRQGFRAGGRAPRGYLLKPVQTGAMRDGEAVSKSVLVPSADAPAVGRYLKARAAGIPRSRAALDAALEAPVSSLIGMEWNALTYAGHTTWNQRNELAPGGGYKGRTKYRPRGEWQVQRDTHEALITEDEAEAILRQLQDSEIGAAVSRGKRSISPHLLTGVLKSPDGRAWEGQAKQYRLKAAPGLKGRYVQKAAVDAAVVEQLRADLESDEFLDALIAAAREAAGDGKDSPVNTLRREIVAINTQVSKAMDLALQLEDPAPAMRKVNELEARRAQMADELARLEKDHARTEAMRKVSRDELAGIVQSLSEELKEAEPLRLKSVIQSAVEVVLLDPETLDCEIQYRLPVERSLSLASPRGGVGWAVTAGGQPFKVGKAQEG